MRIPLIAVAVVFCACGKDFSGTYKGTLALVASCSNGQGINSTGEETWAVTEDGDKVSFAPADNGTCGTFTGKADGDVVTFDAKTCAPETKNDVTGTVSLTSGTVSMSGKALAVSANEAVQLVGSSGSSATCSGTYTGTLTKQ